MKYNPFKAAIGRASVYKNNQAPDHAKNRERLRDALCECANNLIDISGYKKAPVSEKEHIANIKKLASCVSRKCRDFLAGGQFRFGVAQKYFNLKLKKLWREGKINEPPHCPFDRQVLDALPTKELKGVCCNWTQAKDIADYEKWVEAFRSDDENLCAGVGIKSRGETPSMASCSA